ncbi:MAG: RNA polymerase sigma factor [Gammaproteobacteria bacterium]
MSASKPHLLQLLFQRHRAELRATLARRVGADDAEDLVQDAFLRLLQRDAADPVRHPRAFLFKTAFNLTLDNARKAERCTRLTENENYAETLASPAPPPDTAADGAWQFERFVEALGELPLMYQQAFLLSKIHGLTHPEIATRLGVSQKTAQRYILQALGHCIRRLAR